MGSINDQPLSGLAILESTFTWAGRDTATMSYTEASPRPGSPIAASALTQAQPSVSGGQDTDVDVYVTRAGQPNIDHLGQSGATVIYRESAGTWRGWSSPGFLNQVDQLVPWSPVNVFDHHDLITIPSSQKVIALYGNNSSSQEPAVRVLDPATWTWATAVGVLADVTGWDYDDCALAVLPNERVICLFQTNDATINAWRMYYSDDTGATWTLGSSRPMGSVDARLGSNDVDALTDTRTRIVANRDGDVLFVREGNDGSPFALQYASRSQGATFEQVGGDWTTTPPTEINLLKLPSGALGMVSYINGAMTFRKVASPFDALEDATSVQIVGAAYNTLCAWVDDDGMLYAAGSAEIVRTYYSSDEGATWVRMGSSYPDDAGPFYSGDSGTKYLPTAATATMGRAIMMGNSVDAGAGTTYDGMVWVTTVGGWSNVEFPGWFDTTATGQTWLPIELPDTIVTWTDTGGAGSATLTTPGMMQIVTSTQIKSWVDGDVGSTTSRDYVFLIEIEVQSGGSVTTNDCGFSAAIGDGTNVGTLLLNFTATQYAIYDVTGTAGRGTVAHGVTGRLQVLVYHEWVSTTVREVTTYYKENTAENWTKGHDAVTITTAANVAATSVVWGHPVSASATSDWYQMHMAWSATAGALAPADSTATFVGKALNANSYPIPTIGPDTQVARLSMLSGPGLIGDSWDIDAVSDYPVSNLFPRVSPSPRAKWRSTDTTENIVMAWDAGTGIGTIPGQSMAFAMLDCNCPTAVLEGEDGMGWNTVATLDPDVDFTAVSYARAGNIIKSATSGTSGNRFLQRNELAGGWVDLGSSKYRKILRNTSGEWQAEATANSVKARIFLEGVDGTEPTSGTCNIYSKDAVAIVHDVGNFDKYRVRIPSGSTYTSYWEVGTILIGGIAFAGNRHDWGWQWGRAQNSTTRTDRSGTTYTTQEGPAPRSLSIAWQDGVDISRHRDSTSLDFRKATAGDPVAAVDDAAFWQLGILEEVKSGEVPVLALPYIPDTDVTITDPTLFLYSRITSNAQLAHVVGDEDSAEVYRASSMNFEEIV